MNESGAPAARTLRIFAASFLLGTVAEIAILLYAGLPVWVVAIVAVASVATFFLVMKNLRQQRGHTDSATPQAEESATGPGTIEY